MGCEERMVFNLLKNKEIRKFEIVWGSELLRMGRK